MVDINCFGLMIDDEDIKQDLYVGELDIEDLLQIGFNIAFGFDGQTEYLNGKSKTYKLNSDGILLFYLLGDLENIGICKCMNELKNRLGNYLKDDFNYFDNICKIEGKAEVYS